MDLSNLKPSQRTAILAAIDPQSVAAGASVSSAWVPLTSVNRVLATILTGAIGGGGTVDAKLQQATAPDGTGTKDVPDAALVQITAAAGASKQAHLNAQAADLDVNGGYAYLRVFVAAGTAAATVAAVLHGFDFREEPASDHAAASVIQTVG
jgi:hypothetical protein